MLVERRLLRTFTKITRFYLDPTDWASLKDRGAHWRYEMQHVFIEDPEYVDEVLYRMVARYDSYDALVAALRRQDLPAPREVLDGHYWGAPFQSVRELATTIVPTEVLANNGQNTSGLTPDEAFAELHQLALTDKRAFMDRWQYFWCLRNLNVIDSLLRRVFCWRTQFAVVSIGALIYLIGWAIDRPGHDAIATPLAAATSGAVLWLLVVSAGSSVFFIGAFRGTGTFSISFPCEGQNYDPLWNDVIQVGIVAFTTSFLVYGIGGPLFVDPSTLTRFALNGRFVSFAAAAFAFCSLVFLSHLSGVHELMADSRSNALARTTEQIDTSRDANEREELLRHFGDVRALRTWPLRSVTIAQLAGGIALPIIVQAILLYTGLRSG